MNAPFNIGRLNATVGLTLLILAAVSVMVVRSIELADWKFSSMLSVQAYALMYVFYLFSTQSKLELFRSRALLSVLFRQLIVAVVYVFLLIWIWEIIYPSRVSIAVPSSFFYLLWIWSSVVIGALGVVHFLVNYIIDQEQQMKLQAGAAELKNEAELFKLRQQLHPHFLFNSLNSVSALITIQPKEARTMLLKLSSFLRLTIKKEDSKLVPLQQELEELDLYLDIEKVRFGDRLVVVKDIPELLNDALMPPFLLQPLVENAIKFGLYDTLGEVIIAISVREEEHQFVFEITNPYDRKSAAPKGTGFGLEGINRRLYLLYARNDLLVIDKSAAMNDSGFDLFIAKLMIPKHQEKNC